MDALKILAEACADVRPAEPDDAPWAARFTAAPADAGEAAALLRAAADLGLAVVPRGGGTRLRWGAPPTRCDLLVDTRRMDRIVEHAAGDLVVTAEAGTPLAVLGAALAEHGQRLSLDGQPPGATVGGAVASGAAGPLRLLYGSPRDLVIGLTIVRADGAVARSGGKVVKNVAGYDLGRLFAGSSGTLGLIVSATFRLHPVPEARAFVSRTFAGPGEAHDAVQRVLHSPAYPAAVECSSAAGHRVDVLLEGVANGVPDRAAAVADLLGGGTVAAGPPSGWAELPAGGTLVHASVPPGSLRDLLAVPLPADAALAWSASGHARVVLPGGTAPGRVADALAALRALGSAVVRDAPPDVRDAVDVWGEIPGLALMRRVKDQFDPDHRLSPGRFAGGI